MRPLTLSLVVVLLLGTATAVHADDATTPIRLFMPDGQLQSLPVRVFVTHDVTREMSPLLRLGRGTDSRSVLHNPSDPLEPMELARHQSWVENIGGVDVPFTGTLMIFNLQSVDIPMYKAMTRVVPTLTWNEPAGDTVESSTVMTARNVYLGNRIGAVLWTFIVFAALLLIIGKATAKAGKYGVLGLFIGPKGRMSLSRLQIGLWTIAIGSMVFLFGLLQLEVPDLPESILALMGLSLATGAISYSNRSELTDAEEELLTPVIPSISQLVSGYNLKKKRVELSVAKAQMLMWTGILLVLFINKSLIDGVLWEIPWEMVALMGMSQAGYLSPKVDLKIARTPTPAPAQPGGGATTTNPTP